VPQPDSFFQAKLRHHRAEEHVADIERLLDTIEAERRFVYSHKDAKTGQEFVQLPTPDRPENDLRLRIGESVYNLRAALDYSVIGCGGKKGTAQFPLESTPEGFYGRITGKNPKTRRPMMPFLDGVPPGPARRIIRQVQPYKGVVWSRLLGNISNEDKHRELIVLDGVSGQVLTRERVGGLETSPTLETSPYLMTFGDHLEVEINGPVQVALPKGAPVRQAIKELEAEVGNVLALLENAV
jgi:hypothetical protein